MKWLGAAACCAALVFVWGCGKSTEAGTTSLSAQTDTATGAAQESPASAAAEPPALSAKSLLLHPTPRPPGVSAQFDFVGGAGPGACFEMGNPPQVRVLVEPFPGAVESTGEGFNDKGVATYGQPVDVCFDGMGRGPISVAVSGPHGFTISGVLPPLPATRSYHYNNEWSNFDWVPAIEPSWPRGKYVITASAGSISRSHTLTLVSPRKPGLRVLGPSTDPGHNSVPPNSKATLFLTGFKGGSTVTLSTYRTIGFEQNAQFFSAAKVPIPASGNTVVEIPTGLDKNRENLETTFIITARSRGRTLFAPFSIGSEPPWAGLIVGSLPGA